MRMTRARMLLVATWVMLLAQAGLLIWMGGRIVRRPGEIRASIRPLPAFALPPPHTMPATTEASEDELVRALSAQALIKRQIQQQRLLAFAETQQPIGWVLIALGGGLTIMWTWIGWRLWNSPRFAPPP